MAKKRLFEKLDELNVKDIENQTHLLGVSSNFVGGKKVKAGAVIEMGVPYENLVDAFNGSKRFILLSVDTEEYKKLID